VIDEQVAMIRRLIRAVFLCLLAAAAVGCKEEGGVRVKSFAFHGNQAVTDGQLKQVLATQASSKLPWGEKRYFSREQFEADLKRVVAFYTDRGFPDARVTSFDVTLNDAQTAVDITLNIAEGEPIRAERIEYRNFDMLQPRRRARLERRMPLKAGQPLDRALLAASRETALDLLRDSGYPYASVRLEEGEGGTERSRVIVLRAEPGPVAQIGEIEVAGNSSVSDDVVRRHLLFKPGDLYRVSRLHESQRKLYSLELFQFANVEPMDVERQATTVPVRVTVTEGKHRRVNFGFGYGTEEKARAQIDWRHVNFFGGARTASVFARYSGLDSGVRLNLTQPYFFSPNYSIGLSGQAWHTEEPAFTLTTTGGRLTITRQTGRGNRSILGGRPAMSFSLTYANEYEKSTVSDEILEDPSLRDDLIAMGIDPTKGETAGLMSALILDASRNTTNNPLDARRGYLAAVHLEQAGKFLGGAYDYYEVTTEGRIYRSLGPVVLAAQARAGSIDAWGDPTVFVPFFKRYFLGGAGNLRGWGRYDVAPLTDTGLPIGGHTFTNFSVEARLPIWGKLGGVLFFDGGNVWDKAWDFNFGDMRYDVGPGLRYTTPIGPIRADLGYQLNPIPGLLVDGKPESRRFRFHFSIGQAF
jgi:outer membrane protein assembly complex protein YaeT